MKKWYTQTKPLICHCPWCWSSTFGWKKPLRCAQNVLFKKRNKPLDLQVFSWISKTMKKLPWILYTIMDIVYISEGFKSAFSTHGMENIWLNLFWWMSLPYKNQYTDLYCKSMKQFLYDRDICHERVNSLR